MSLRWRKLLPVLPLLHMRALLWPSIKQESKRALLTAPCCSEDMPED